MKKFIMILLILSLSIIKIPVIGSANIKVKEISKEYLKEMMKLCFLDKVVNNYEIVYYANVSSKKYNVPIELILSVMYTETKYKNVISKKNRNGSIDFGLMQVNNVAHPEYKISDLMCKSINIDAGTKYLSDCLRASKGNIKLALKMYNAGIFGVLHGKVPVRSIQYANNIIQYMNNSFSNIQIELLI